jgi:hypothetical protein
MNPVCKKNGGHTFSRSPYCPHARPFNAGAIPSPSRSIYILGISPKTLDRKTFAKISLLVLDDSLADGQCHDPLELLEDCHAMRTGHCSSIEK